MEHPVLNMAASSYLKLLHYAPSIYRTMYHSGQIGPMRRFIRTTLRTAVRRQIERARPDVIVATHPFPGSVVAHLRYRGELNCPVAMAVTDFMPHPLWVAIGVDQYFVSSELAAQKLEELGVARGLIAVKGIPIRTGFAVPGPRRKTHRST